MVSIDQTAGSAAATQSAAEIRIYAHSPILYWWVIWAYGYVCAALTYFQGERITLSESAKPIFIHTSPWVGLSFTLLLLLVIVATSVRARGINALLLLLLLGGAATGFYVVMNTPGLWTTAPSLLLHMNLAFYLLLSTVLFVVWFVIVFTVDRLSYWRVRGTQVERVQLFGSALGRAPESWSALHIRLTRYSDDLIAHKILALGFLGLGTSDIEAKVSIFGGGHEQFRIENVWRAATPLKAVQAAMGQKATVVI
ncbi:hypothetical protein [Hyphomicrobium sp. CS1GBMeth3]|uniref:hypothetical protein n=1 Tax=Hyphomicrobium sp. CS1GBMeth3 TaxID=1892845 RepID=UPI0009314852|nr:hypothetical protein [Hyphomicrobium sp. CS1GBMeth3]